MKKNLFLLFVRSDFVLWHCSHRVVMMMMREGVNY